MRTITSKIVKELASVDHAQPAVTIYTPMHTTASPPHITENQIRLKNLINRAISDIVRQYGEDHALATQLASWFDMMHDDLHFWEQQTPGLLLCAVTDNTQWFNLPIDTDEYVAIDETYHLAPVIALFNKSYHYYVLTIAQHQPKLFRGDLYRLGMSDIKLPASVQAALGIDEQNQRSENQGSASGFSPSTGSFNGRGGARNPQEEDRMKFFRIIDRIVCDKVQPGLPLILAGIEAETVEYRHISKHPKLLKGIISGSHADFNMEDLHRRALTIISQELIQPAHRLIIQEYEELEGVNPGRIAKDIRDIETATDAGRVEKLLAPMESQTTDTIRNSRQPVTKITLPNGEEGRLLNRLAMKVWQMKGTVVSLTPNEMPHGAPLAARLRY